LGIYADLQNAYISEAIHLTLQCIAELDRQVRHEGALFRVVIIPSDFQVVPGAIEKAISELGVSKSVVGDMDLQRPQRVLLDFCDRQGIKTLSLLGAFRSWESPDMLYRGRHLSRAGQQLVADEVARFLQVTLSSEDLAKKPDSPAMPSVDEKVGEAHLAHVEHMLSGRGFMIQRKWGESKEQLLRALQFAPDRESVQIVKFSLARVLEETNDEMAITYYSEIDSSSGHYQEALVRMGRLLNQSHDGRRAFMSYAAAAEIDGALTEYATTQLALLGAHLATVAPEFVLEITSKVLLRHPHLTKIHLLNAASLYKMGRYRESMEASQTMLESHPELGIAKVHLAECRIALGETAEAREILHTVVEQESENSRVRERAQAILNTLSASKVEQGEQ
jgi:tetratricopeptide (TPR) repeat protein